MPVKGKLGVCIGRELDSVARGLLRVYIRLALVIFFMENSSYLKLTGELEGAKWIKCDLAIMTHLFHVSWRYLALCAALYFAYTSVFLNRKEMIWKEQEKNLLR